MAIIAVLYAAIVWLVFFRLKLMRWGWLTGTVTVLVGVLVCTVFVGFLSYLAPTGRVMVIGHVVEVTPNVSGQITEISVQPNELVKADTVLFKIDPTPYDAQVRTVDAQLKFQELRLGQMKQLAATSSGRAFDVEQRQAEVDQLRAPLDKAKYELDQTTVRAPTGRRKSVHRCFGPACRERQPSTHLIRHRWTKSVGFFSTEEPLRCISRTICRDFA